MRTSLVATVVALTAFAPFPAAHAEPPLTDVNRCGFSSVGDPQAEGMHVGEVDGGPLAIGARTGYLTCTIQVNASTHAGADACSVTGAETFGVVAAAAPCTYAAGLVDNLYYCTQVTVTSPVAETWYWDDWQETSGTGAWSRDPDADCASVSWDDGPPEWSWDEVLCPWFATAFPPEGDVVLPEPFGLFWDCPPYES